MRIFERTCVLGLAGALLLAATSLWAQTGQTLPVPGEPALVGVRSWAPPPGFDSLVAARAALRDAPPQKANGSSYQFSVAANQPMWYALELGPAAEATVLELTHPSLRSAELFLEGNTGEPAQRSGRAVPLVERASQRFPATLELPAAPVQSTVYVRATSLVPTSGYFLLETHASWLNAQRLQRWLVSFCYGAAGLAALFSLACAVRLRSVAYGYYFLFVVCTGSAGLTITGFGEAWLWPGFSAWRGQISSALACAASGLVLALAERAFALDRTAPRFARLLNALGVAFPALGIAGLAFGLPVQQVITHVTAGCAAVCGLVSCWLAWRSHNRVTVWLLVGFTPVIAGVGLTGLAIGAAIPFAPWLLLAMPMGSLLEIPFNLMGLHLLQRRRMDVMRSERLVERYVGPKGESYRDMVQRVAAGALSEDGAPGVSTLALLRFEGLAAGALTLGRVDAVEVERYVHSMLVSAAQPGSRVGRWTFHEIVSCSFHAQPEEDIPAMTTALFARALRCQSFGMNPDEPRLRIALSRFDPAAIGLVKAVKQLGSALDAPANRKLRRVVVRLG